jgi:hypothetical protein
MEKRTLKRKLDNLLFSYIPFFGMPMICFFICWYLFEQTKGDPLRMAVAIGGMCYVSALTMVFTLKGTDPINRWKLGKELTVTFDMETTKRLLNLQRLLEHEDVRLTLYKAANYYEVAAQTAHEGGKVTIEAKGGDPEPFDPVSLDARKEE